MNIDVIIPVYRPDGKLTELISRLQDQTRPVRDIILMNTEESLFEEFARRTEFWKKFSMVKVWHVSKREFDHGGTRHAGVQHSDAEIFVTMTQDAMPADRDLILNLTRRLEGNTAAAYARQLPSAHSSLPERISRAFNYPEQSRLKSSADLDTLGIKTFFCSNVCAAYRRDIYDELGGFIRHTIFNEDMIYAADAVRAGYAIAYEADARVIHSHDYTNLQQLHRNFDLGVSQADHPEVFRGVPSEGEGMKMVREVFKQMRIQGKLYRFPGFCIQCGFRYTGYLLGKHYRRLPRRWILALTGNREYWK